MNSFLADKNTQAFLRVTVLILKTIRNVFRKQPSFSTSSKDALVSQRMVNFLRYVANSI